MYDLKEELYPGTVDEFEFEDATRTERLGNWYSSKTHRVIGYEFPQASMRVRVKPWSEPPDQEKLFRQLADEWRCDTSAMSFIQRIAMHPAYQRIIGMGLPAVPLILADLEANGGPWFWALEAITGLQPASDVEPGNYAARAERWLEWGRNRSLI